MRKIILLSTAYFLLNASLTAQINALFSVDALQGCSPLVVQFADASSSNGTIVSWDWDFGDGSTDDVPNPIYTFVVQNDYNVCLTVTDDLAQSNTFCLNISVFENPVLDAVITDPLCFGGFDGAINLIVSNGTPPYTYTWSNGATTEDLINLQAGVYSVSVADANNCSTEELFVLTEPAFINVTLSVIQEILCQGECNGSILAAASGGCSPYTYLWSNGAIGPENDFLCSGGFYGLTVTDCNGCVTTSNIIMPVAPAPLELSYITTCATSANDGTINLSVSGGSPPYTYTWSTGVTTQDLINLAPGDYTIQVTDGNGCTITETIPLSTLIVDMTNDTVVCAGDELQLFVDAPDAVSYNWIPSNNLSCTDCPNPVYTADIFGELTYLVTVVDAAGCIDQDFVIITVQSYLDFGLLQFSNSPVFEGDTLELYCHVFNSATVDWTGPAGFESTECNPSITSATGANEGQYAVMITDEFGCEASASADVDILTIIDSVIGDTTICPGSNVQLWVEAPDAVSVEWSPAASLDDPFSFTPIATHTEPTLYTVVVEDAAANTDIYTVFVGIDIVPVITITAPPAVCNGDSLTICVNPGIPLTYSWTGPGFTSNQPCLSIPEMTPGNAGCYILTYTTTLGCSGQTQVCIDVIDFEIESITEDVMICSGESATLEVTVPGAVLYQWVPEEGLDCSTCPEVTATPEQTTTYLVTATDANGCQDEAFSIVFIEEDCVWPGDTDTSKLVDNFDLLNIGLAYDSVGPLRENATIFWDGQSASNWLLTNPGIDVDFKHIDCNGDGMINADDTLAIVQNWGEVHNFTGGGEVNFTLDPPFYVEPDTLIEGESINLAVILGEMDNPVNDIYGLAFSLEYDSTVVVPGSAKMTFNSGWIGDKGVDMITIQKTFVSPGVVNVAMTRIDGEEMDGFGEIGQLFITIEDDILFRNGNEDNRNTVLEAAFNISNVRMINSQGVEIPVGAIETFAVVDGTVGIKNLNWKNSISVQPNPAKDAFFITSKNIVIDNISLFAITGELLFSQKSSGVETRVDTQNLFPGIYLLKVQTEAGTMMEKVVVLK